jgi:hypothetical protein
MSTKRSKPRAGEPDRASPVDEIVAAPLPLPAERLPCIIGEEDEPMGGDPPCWAHLFEDGDETPPGDR